MPEDVHRIYLRQVVTIRWFFCRKMILSDHELTMSGNEPLETYLHIHNFMMSRKNCKVQMRASTRVPTRDPNFLNDQDRGELEVNAIAKFSLRHSASLITSIRLVCILVTCLFVARAKQIISIAMKRSIFEAQRRQHRKLSTWTQRRRK